MANLFGHKREIQLFKRGAVWYLQLFGDAEAAKRFGEENPVIPTEFLSTTPAETVCARVRELNPDAKVVIKPT